jgi:hypothetical protein
MSKKFRDLKKNGKVTIKAPKVKERKKFAPATKVEKPKKGKGSYARKKNGEMDDAKLTESSEIFKFVECILGENHADAQKHLSNIIDNKLQQLISKEIEKPLF